MKEINKKIGALAIGLAMLVVFGAGAATADSSKVTVTWIIPSDTTFSLTWPGGESQIVFAPGDNSFNETRARSQTNATATLTITNNGNTAVKICGNFTSTCYDRGLRFFNISVGRGDNKTSSPYWSGDGWNSLNCLDNLTTNRTIIASIAAGGGTESLWFYSSGANMSYSAEASDYEYLFLRSYLA